MHIILLLSFRISCFQFEFPAKSWNIRLHSWTRSLRVDLELFVVCECRTWSILGLWVSILINLKVMTVELERSLHSECWTLSISGLWLLSLVNFALRTVDLGQSRAYECRAWSILALWVSNLVNLEAMNVSFGPSFCSTIRFWKHGEAHGGIKNDVVRPPAYFFLAIICIWALSGPPFWGRKPSMLGPQRHLLASRNQPFCLLLHPQIHIHYAYTHTHAHPHTQTHGHTHTHTHTDIHTHAHPHSHTHTHRKPDK